MNTLLITV